MTTTLLHYIQILNKFSSLFFFFFRNVIEPIVHLYPIQLVKFEFGGWDTGLVLE